MAVNPTGIKSNGDVEVYCDHCQKKGKVKLDDINFVLDPNTNAIDERYIVLECPATGDASSTHPAAGGSAPEMVQRLFAFKFGEEDRKVRKNQKINFAHIADKLKDMVSTMESPDRFKLEEALKSDDDIFTSNGEIERKRQPPPQSNEKSNG